MQDERGVARPAANPAASARQQRVLLIALMVLAVVAAGAIGYYAGAAGLGFNRGALASPAPVTQVWIDEEVINKTAGSGSIAVLYLHCSYHYSDGRVILRDIPIANRLTDHCPSQP